MNSVRSVRKISILILPVLFLLFTLCSCGSELDGTWKSHSDPDTRIKFSGEKVRISYDGFRIDGTYEIDDEYNITFHLSDREGNKYKITARLTHEKKQKLLILTNSKGDSEVFTR